MMQLKLNQSQVKAIQNEFAKIPKLVSDSARIVSKAMAFRYAKELKTEYMFGQTKAAVPLKEGTILKRSYGKRGTGRRRNVPAYGGTTPLFRTGTLASSVIVKSYLRSGKTVRSVIKINPRVILPGGGIAWRVAMVQEFGIKIDMTAYVWVRAYLTALYAKVAGTNEKVYVNPGTKTLEIIIPPRPVWQPVVMRMLRRQPREFAQLFHKQLQRQTQFNIVLKTA